MTLADNVMDSMSYLTERKSSTKRALDSMPRFVVEELDKTLRVVKSIVNVDFARDEDNDNRTVGGDSEEVLEIRKGRGEMKEGMLTLAKSIKQMEEKIAAVQDEQKKGFEELKDQLDALVDNIPLTAASSKEIALMIKQCSKLEDGKELSSPSTKIGNLEWCLTAVVEKTGCGKRDRILGCYLDCLSWLNDPWESFVEVEFRLMNHQSEKRFFSKSFKKLLRQPEDTNWGCDDFIKWDEALDESEGYLMDDSLLIEARVKVYDQHS